MTDKLRCGCMGTTNESTEHAVETAAGAVELAIVSNLPNLCPNMVAVVTARICGSTSAQVDDVTIEEARAEMIRQFDIGYAYAQHMMATGGGQHVH